MINPARAIANQFQHRSALSLLAAGITLSLVDFVALSAAAAREGVLPIDRGVGLLQNYGLLSMLLGNCVVIYVAKKYHEAVCSVRTSKAIRDGAPIAKELSTLTKMISMEREYQFVVYLLMFVGAAF